MPRLLIILLSLLFASCASSGPNLGSSTTQTLSWERDEWGHRPGPRGFHTVILDAGHGGHDSGAVSHSNGVKEKDMALDTVHRIAAELRGKVKVEMMRADDRFIDLDSRATRASSSDGTILVSIHYNSGARGRLGPETYWWRVDSFGLARRCQRAMSGVAPVSRGDSAAIRRRLRLTRNPSIPSVLLELGYLSTPSEAKHIADPKYRQKMAKAIAHAILEQQRNGDPPGPLPRAITAPPSRPTDPPGS